MPCIVHIFNIVKEILITKATVGNVSRTGMQARFLWITHGIIFFGIIGLSRISADCS